MRGLVTALQRTPATAAAAYSLPLQRPTQHARAPVQLQLPRSASCFMSCIPSHPIPSHALHLEYAHLSSAARQRCEILCDRLSSKQNQAESVCSLSPPCHCHHRIAFFSVPNDCIASASQASRRQKGCAEWASPSCRRPSRPSAAVRRQREKRESHVGTTSYRVPPTGPRQQAGG